MAKEEVTIVDKFTKWKVYRRKGKQVIESVEETTPMTPSQALKYFKASAIMAMIG